MRDAPLLLVVLGGLGAGSSACSDVEVTCGDSVPVTAMSYNIAGQTGASGENIAAQIAAAAPDFVGLQECADCDWFLDQLPAAYEMASAASAGVTIVFDESRWQLETRGVLPLGDNDDGWGPRVASWARFSHRETGHCLYVYSTHWCMPLRTSDDACDESRQLDYADALVDHLATRAVEAAPVVLAGDFNVFDGFEDSQVVQTLLAAGLTDAFRAVNPDADGTTYQGNTWAPAGRIDYIFATEPVTVLASSIDRDSIPDGDGSDHYPVLATLEFPTPDAAE